MTQDYNDRDREESTVRRIVKTYFVDDGWNLPEEIIEEIEIKVLAAKEEEYREIKRIHDQHRGLWLTEETAGRYDAMSWVYRVLNGFQYIGKVREFGEELCEQYGITQLEAVNNVLGNAAVYGDYIEKYERIKNLKPRCVNVEDICSRVLMSHEELWAAS